MTGARDNPKPQGEDGYMLLAVVVMVALVLLALSVAAPVVARDLRREKELESERRARQYVRAIELYQRKFKNQYPPSIKALEGTNNIRYLRQQYVDPLTGEANWRLIHQGEQKTKIHILGKELDELVLGLSAAPTVAGATSIGGTAATPSTTVGNTTGLAAGFSGATIGGSAGTPGSTTAGSTSASSSSTSADATLGVIVGVGPSRSGPSILTPEQQTDYSAWEFWWDPRIALLKASSIPTGGGVGGGGVNSTNASSFGKDAVSGQSNSSSGTSSNGTSTTPKP
jgi:type II secretory pathway pseudopilin PulG